MFIEEIHRKGVGNIIFGQTFVLILLFKISLKLTKIDFCLTNDVLKSNIH